MFHNSLR